MGVDSLRKHLRPYSIRGRRATTIRHAFASARAPTEVYDAQRIAEAMRVLGQHNLDALNCVYCGADAETWDHLGALVRKSAPSGLGHTLGNLVPACRTCNSKRGNKPFEAWMKACGCSAQRIARVRAYHARYAAGGTLVARRALTPTEDARLAAIEEDIIRLMAEADAILDAMRAPPVPRLRRSRRFHAPAKPDA
ncbi:MAG TPA: HNH endonuclease [Candidatus Thermoplasmatota archaeon]|nr:HNH endonuclease [Candidatus Thermoplasmatota archaeon]